MMRAVNILIAVLPMLGCSKKTPTPAPAASVAPSVSVAPTPKTAEPQPSSQPESQELAADADSLAGVRCIGGKVCSGYCCALADTLSSNPVFCVERSSDCKASASGDITAYGCDGPEDCTGGEVCCVIPADKIQSTQCITKADCTGSYKHPRYTGILPFLVVCHKDEDCERGKCTIYEPKTNLKTCR